MKDARILLLVLVVVAWLRPQRVGAQDLSSLFEQVKPSVVVIETAGSPVFLDGLELSAVTQGLGLQGGFLPVPIGDATVMLGGDIVLEVMGVPIEGPEGGAQIREKLASLKRRDTVSVVVLRKGRRVQLKCRL